MTETKDTTDKTLRGGARKPLSLQRTVESGHVRQNFSHGRSKSVVVEKRKTRKLAGPAEAETAGSAAPVAEAPAAARRPARPESAAVVDRSPAPGRGLSDEERDARARALAAARQREDIERIEAKERAEKAAALAAAAPPPPPPPAPEPAAAPAVTEPPRPAPAPAARAPAARAPEARSSAPSSASTHARPPRSNDAPRQRTTYNPALQPREGGRPREIDIPLPSRAKPEPEAPVKRPVRAPQVSDDEDNRPKGGGPRKPGPTRTPTPKPDEKRERVKLTINNAFDEKQRERSLASLRRKREREKLKAMGIPQSREKIVREVVIPEVITIQELANRMTERAVDVIKYLMKEGAMHKINDVIDADTAELIVQEFGHTPRRVSEADVETGFIGEKDDEGELEGRAPVVTIMGHVDHGKTSLLDAIRQANVVSGEAGGITQHIGAYQVTTPAGEKVTFIDTPGHEAFTAMRARGAKVTDIVVLVVAADDGVMPQTVEAINHAKAAGVPIIVAINKIDKPQADPNRVRTELLQHEIVVESMSGETLDVPVSALKRTNLDKLLESIHLQAEILDLKANPNRSAEGIVVEAKLERGRGPVGTVLVQRGTLKVGDIVVAGTAWGRVRALIDDRGANTTAAGPSVPVEILGFDSAPEAGDQFAVVESEARAREITDYRVRKRRDALGSAGSSRTLEQMMQQLKEAGRKDFTLLVKGDVQGSVEAIAGSLRKLSTDEVGAQIVHSGVGGITESDVALASASKAVIVGFNVRANAQAKALAERDGIEIRYYNIIYDLIDDVKAAMSGLLAPTIREIYLGKAEILEVFNITKTGKVAGCRVTEGKVERGAKVRLIRDDVV
ncbi:MAG TPA: translation initiation factor IF-2, partial [Hyphomicrobium sp.]|nr:translation initiation factor IF-2 [Hyphomicrobium sp.]